MNNQTDLVSTTTRYLVWICFGEKKLLHLLLGPIKILQNRTQVVWLYKYGLGLQKWSGST